MSILTPEIAAVFGALDSAAFADGDPADAHILRSLAMSANRLLARGEPLVNLLWDNHTAGIENGTVLAGFGWPAWMPVLPSIPVTKSPRTNSAKLFVRHNMRTGEIVRIQVATRRAPFTEILDDADADNILKLTGTNSWTTETLSGIPLMEESTEEIGIYVLGEATSTLGSTATNGAPNTGVIDSILGSGHVVDAAATWNAYTNVNNWAVNGHALIIEDASLNRLTAPRWIERVPLTSELIVFPYYESGEGLSLQGQNYRIVELPRWSFSQIAIYSETRSAF